jgi:predicted nucleic acid-binding protein
VIASAHGPKCVAADAVAAEISRHIPRLAERRGLDQALPTIAVALKLGLPVWSQDKDLTDAGLEVLTTGDLLDTLRAAGHIE